MIPILLRNLFQRTASIRRAATGKTTIPGANPRALRLGAAALALGLLGACANMSSVPPGTPIDQVQARFGPPTLTCPAADGGQRVIWSKQPFGQFAWGANVDASGRIGQIEALLTDRHFSLLGQGTWTPEQVLCEFGPPAEKGGVGLPSSMQIVWSYRYRQDGVWNSLMHVYFGQDGVRVTRHHPGPDPMYEERRMLFW